MIGFLIYLVFIGLIAGYLARALVPGKNRMSMRGTIVLGIIGSFIGGFLGYVLFDHNAGDGGLQASGLIGSVVGSIIALLVYRSANRRRART